MLAGGVPPGAESLLARVNAPPLAGHVDLRGYIAPEEREALYAGAIALVVPSHTEGFGIPALEAMTVGVPVVAADRGALPEVLGDAGLFFDPADSATLMTRLREILLDPARRERMRQTGWRRAELFRWEQSAHAVRSAWARAIEHRHRTS